MDLKEFRGLLIPVVMPKIPEDVRLHITRENHGQVDKLMETIRVEVEAHEASEASRVAMGKILTKPKQVEWRGISNASALMAVSQNPIQCVYCEGSHYSASCEAVNILEERCANLIGDGRCFA